MRYHFDCTALKTLLRYLATVALLLLSNPGGWRLWAQAGPPGGAPLREVARLARVAEPPGGLIPYRAGELWGYADTTGRVVIQPCIPWPGVQDAVLFDHGFATIPAYLAPGAVATLTGLPLRPEVGLLILNARGEVLPLAREQAAVLQPDSSLCGVLRTHAHGQVELRQLEHEYHQNTGFGAAAFRRVQASDDLPIIPQETTPTLHQSPLGAHRVTWAREEAGKREVDERFALADDHGRRLTGYQFSSLEAFHDGLAIAEQRRQGARTEAAHYGYVDTTGHLVVPVRYDNASAFSHGRAVVEKQDRQGILDQRGRYLLALQSHHLYGPDADGYIQELVPTSPVPAGTNPDAAAQLRYLPPPGQPPITLRFDDGGSFLRGRARVRLGQRQGLIDSLGRWVTPLAYERLLALPTLHSEPNEVGESGPYDPPGDADRWRTAVGISPRHPVPDPRYLVARRQGKFGIVARRSGREVVPADYDSVLVNPCYGMVSMQRAGRAYLVALSTGRAVAGVFQGIVFLTPQGKHFHLTDPAAGAWALADTTGQLVTAWLPGTGYPTAQGWMLSQESHAWTLRTAAGKLAYTSPTPIELPAWTAQWTEIQQNYRRYWEVGSGEYWLLPVPGSSRYVHGPFLVHDEANGRLTWLDAQLHDVGHYPLPTSSVAAKPAPQVIPLPGYWRYVGGYKNQFDLDSRKPFQLLTDTGRLLPAPPGAPWAFFFSFDYPRAWYQHGVLPTTQGYVTRGGRHLWQ